MSRFLLAAVAAFLLPACMPATGAPSPGGGGSAGPAAEPLPGGYGSLRQDQITLFLTPGEVQVRVTPLDEGIIRLTAPDTWRRLAAARARAGAADDEARVFLVAVQTEAPGGAAFQPEDVHVVARGVMHRPRRIVGLTPGWGGGPLRQRSPEQALYVFGPEVDPDMDFVVEIGRARSGSWADRIPVLEAERARVRARAGVGGIRNPVRTS